MTRPPLPGVPALIALAAAASAQVHSYSESFDGLAEPAALADAGWSVVTGTQNPTVVSAAFSVNDGANVVKVTALDDLGSQFGSGHVFLENDFLQSEPNAFGRGDALIYTTEPLVELGATTLDLNGAYLAVDFAHGSPTASGPSWYFALRIGSAWYLYDHLHLGATTASVTHALSAGDGMNNTMGYIPLIFEPNQSWNADARLIPNDSLAGTFTSAMLSRVTAVGIYVAPASDTLPTRFDRFTLTNFAVDEPLAGELVCAGDGNGQGCPCGNDIPSGQVGGCLSSIGQGGRLVGVGAANVAADTFALRGSLMPDTSVLYFQGTAPEGGGAGAVFGDGLRCASGTVVRLGTKTNSSGASQFPGPGDAPVHVQGGVGAGATRTYQAWYRNSAAYCTSATFNLTNGIVVTWQ